MRDPDIVVIGSGPNGLVEACALCRLGMRVLVLVSKKRSPGGALGSESATLPGFVHDVGAAFFPFAKKSPAFRDLELERYGLRWAHAPIDTCHPSKDGSVALITRDLDRTARHFGSPRDGDAFVKLSGWHIGVEDDILAALLSPIPSLRPFLRLGPMNLLRLARLLAASGTAFSRRLFQSPAAQKVLPSLALHADVAPDDRFGAAMGYMLGMLAATGGYPVPRGGAQTLADSMVRMLEAHGGRLRLGARVQKILVEGRRAVGVRLADGEEIRSQKAVLADTAAPALLLHLLDGASVPGRVIRKMKAFVNGWGTFKVDWALSRAVPWTAEAARESAVVHAGEDLEDLRRFSTEVRNRRLPSRPYLVIGQQSLVDPTRAPAGQHTLWAYTHVPSSIDGGYAPIAESFADTMERRIEELAPGFRQCILARRIVTPRDLEDMDENLVGGDLGGGSSAWNNMLIFRPLFPYFRYRMPVKGVYLCSSYAHPGAGVHGMCGYNAANIAAKDIA